MSRRGSQCLYSLDAAAPPILLDQLKSIHFHRFHLPEWVALGLTGHFELYLGDPDAMRTCKALSQLDFRDK